MQFWRPCRKFFAQSPEEFIIFFGKIVFPNVPLIFCCLNLPITRRLRAAEQLVASKIQGREITANSLPTGNGFEFLYWLLPLKFSDATAHLLFFIAKTGYLRSNSEFFDKLNLTSWKTSNIPHDWNKPLLSKCFCFISKLLKSPKKTKEVY